MPLRRIDLKIAVPSGEEGRRFGRTLERIHAAAGGRRMGFRLELRPEGPVVHLLLPAEEVLKVRLKPSGRFEYPCWKGEPGKRLVYYAGSHEFEANVVGGRLMRGKPGEPNAWHFRLLLEAMESDGSDSRQERVSLDTLPIEPGLRVMSVAILNHGTTADVPFAACSVFKVVQGRPATALAFPADPSQSLWAQQERLFFLSMPTERGRFSLPTPAELIVQEALGNKYGSRRGWYKRQNACKAILIGYSDGQERMAFAARREARLFGLAAGCRPLRDKRDQSPFDQAQTLQRVFWRRQFGHS